jgi:hypothetical protein
MDQVSTTLEVFFILIALLTVWQFYKASHQSKLSLSITLLIAILQLLLGEINFYENENSIPPRFLLLILPAIVIIFLLFLTKKGNRFLDSLNIKQLAILHTVRVPVELVLYFLYIAKTIPQIMTFEGSNFDIIAGFTAPIMYYFGFIKKSLSAKMIIVWNMLSLALLINIVFIAILSAKTPFQKFGLHQPNIAIAHFPFTWLPSIIVPIVMLSHLATIKQLLQAPKKNIPTLRLENNNLH